MDMEMGRGACVCECGKDLCSFSCQRTLRGGGALEIGDLRLLEDGRESGGALVSDVVVPDTARDGCGGTVREQVRVSGG